MIIYKITNKINDKAYIGYDTSMNFQRWKKHKKAATRYKPLDNEKYSYLYKALRKYSIQNFVFETIDDGKNIEELKEKEIFWIAHYNTFLGEGYNQTPGGDGGCGNASFLNSATPERLEEYHKLLSKRIKESWDFHIEEERQKRIDNSHKWLRVMNEVDKKEHYIKIGRKVSEWRQSLTKQEKEELDQINREGVKRYWANLSEQELVEWGKARSKSVQTHWDGLTEEERKERNKNSGKRKTYLIISPNGTIIEAKNLPEFCKENNLSRNAMYKISKSGKLHKEWRCEIISD